MPRYRSRVALFESHQQYRHKRGGYTPYIGTHISTLCGIEGWQTSTTIGTLSYMKAVTPEVQVRKGSLGCGEDYQAESTLMAENFRL